MSLTCLTCRAVVDLSEGESSCACPGCGNALVHLRGPWIDWSGPGGKGRTIVFDGMTIGRLERYDLVLRDREVSKHHADFRRNGDEWVICDAGSVNGVFVNGKRTRDHRLQSGDKIVLGATKLIFHGPPVQASTGAFAIVPKASDEETIQAVLKVEQDDFKPVDEIANVDDLRADYERLRLTYQFHRYMASELDPKSLVENILKIAFDLVPADRGAILLREDENGPFDLAVTRYRGGPSDEIRISTSMLRRAIAERTAILSTDALADMRFRESVSIVDGNIRSAMCVPLVGQREVLGAVHLDTRELTGAFSVKDLQLLSVLAQQAAAFLERARLRGKLDREQKTRERLERFLSPEVLREVVERGLDLEAPGRLDSVSVLFCDIRRFTSLAETTEPKQLLKLLNGFFEQMVDVVFRHGGVLDKFIGDAVMALWGAPIRRPGDARLAVQAGLDMLAAVSALNSENSKVGLPPLEIGVGVNTGETIIGTVGSSRRMEYTVLGDAVNLAARVCDLAQGNQLLITESALEGAAADGAPPNVRKLPPVTVRGRKKQVQVYEVLGFLMP